MPVGDVMLQRQQQQHSARSKGFKTISSTDPYHTSLCPDGLNKSSAPKGRHHQKTGTIQVLLLLLCA